MNEILSVVFTLIASAMAVSWVRFASEVRGDGGTWDLL